MDVNSFLQNFKQSAARQRNADARGARAGESLTAASRNALLSELSSSDSSSERDDEEEGEADVAEVAGVRRVGRKVGLLHYDNAQQALAGSSLEQRIASTELPSLRVYTTNEPTPVRSGNVAAELRRRLRPALPASRSQLYKRARAQATEALRDELRRESASLLGNRHHHQRLAAQTTTPDGNVSDGVDSSGGLRSGSSSSSRGQGGMLDVDELLSSVVPSAGTNLVMPTQSTPPSADAATMAQNDDKNAASFAAMLSSALLLPPVKKEEDKVVVKTEVAEEDRVAPSAVAGRVNTEAAQHGASSATGAEQRTEASQGKRKKTLFQRAKAIVHGDETAMTHGDVLHVDRM